MKRVWTVVGGVLGAIGMVAMATASGPGSDAVPTDHGKVVFQRCAACHLPSGQGVPGSFPPLAGRLSEIASTDAGRTYMIMAVSAGLMGEIDVNGQKYRGVMPAQAGLTDEDIAAVLNYAMSLKGANGEVGSNVKKFDKDEVGSVRSAHFNLNPTEVHGLRSAAMTALPVLEQHE
ncbi:MAG: c-type cytochrome [Alphaproteobacteria bacterium]|nr:c-type cytochrome [Alphaproteobacteria bacterium]